MNVESGRFRSGAVVADQCIVGNLRYRFRPLADIIQILHRPHGLAAGVTIDQLLSVEDGTAEQQQPLVSPVLYFHGIVGAVGRTRPAGDTTLLGNS